MRLRVCSFYLEKLEAVLSPPGGDAILQVPGGYWTCLERADELVELGRAAEGPEMGPEILSRPQKHGSFWLRSGCVAGSQTTWKNVARCCPETVPPQQPLRESGCVQRSTIFVTDLFEHKEGSTVSKLSSTVSVRVSCVLTARGTHPVQVYLKRIGKVLPAS